MNIEARMLHKTSQMDISLWKMRRCKHWLWHHTQIFNRIVMLSKAIIRISSKHSYQISATLQKAIEVCLRGSKSSAKVNPQQLSLRTSVTNTSRNKSWTNGVRLSKRRKSTRIPCHVRKKLSNRKWSKITTCSLISRFSKIDKEVPSSGILSAKKHSYQL